MDSIHSEGKVCTGCGIWKLVEGFHKQNGQLLGRAPRCRDCTKEYNAKRYAENKEEYAERARLNYLINKETIKKKSLATYYKDREKGIARAVEWCKQNPEKHREYDAKWARANPGKKRENTRRRYARCKGAKTVPFEKHDLDAKARYWGNKCWMCGGKHESWDHVKPLNAGGSHILANLRPSCRSCNSRKRSKWPVDGLIWRAVCAMPPPSRPTS